MSIRQLRARLDRLTPPESSVAKSTAIEQKQDRAREFANDQTLANALRDDRARLAELMRKKEALSQVGSTLTWAEQVAERRLRWRIDNHLMDKMRYPDGYGPAEERQDRDRLEELRCKRLSSADSLLSDEEDAEEAQVMARVAAWEAYPSPYWHDPMQKAFEAMHASSVKFREEEDAQIREKRPHRHPPEAEVQRILNAPVQRPTQPLLSLYPENEPYEEDAPPIPEGLAPYPYRRPLRKRSDAQS